MYEFDDLTLLDEALKTMQNASTLPYPRPPDELLQALRPVLLDAAQQLGAGAPHAHPYYLGHMLKPAHPAARLGYAMALWLNPNNHAFDGGRASSRMEIEAVAQIAGLFGWDDALGHLCSGGTVANLEALWISREAVRATLPPSAPLPGIAASTLAHYSHARAASLLGVPFHAVPVDAQGRMDPDALQRLLARESIGTVVATLGTPGCGAVDPLDAIADLCVSQGIRLHADAAYGGYFALASNLDHATASALASISRADSIVVDPHKHGLQPYGCGCVLLRDPSLRPVYAHAAGYAYLASEEPHLGTIALECSRPGASAVALWCTQRLLPLTRGGVFAQGLESGRRAALMLWRALSQDERFAVPFPPELDVVVWAVRAPSARAASACARQLHATAEAMDLHLSIATLPRAMLEACSPVEVWDAQELVVLRACVMKPEHLAWMERILAKLDAAARDACAPGNPQQYRYAHPPGSAREAS